MSSPAASFFRVVLFGAGILASTGAATGATRVDLNGDWRFAIDEAKAGVARGWTKAEPDTAETVRVPHTWNIGQHDDYEGTAWYFKAFLAPAVPPGGALLRTSVMATHDRATLDRALDAFASVKDRFEAEHGALPEPGAH